MTAVPLPPAGSYADPRPPVRLHQVAAWRHVPDRLPYIEVIMFIPPDGPASVTVGTGPARIPVAGITDPAELRAASRALDAAAQWLEAQHADPAPRSRPDGQLVFEVGP